MIRLENLPAISQQALHGLTADEALKQRILDTAVSGIPRRSFRLSPRLIPLLCVTAGIVMMAIGLAGFPRSAVPGVRTRYFTSATHTSVSPMLLRSFLAEGISD